MFKWSESVTCIDVPADKVIHLFRSMRDVQLALPGIHAQLASAFICQYEKDSGISTAAVFHLHKSNLLAFYHDDPQVVPAAKSDSMLDQSLNFIESMGFLMTDQDIHLLDAADRDMLWSSLPLKAGLQPEGESAPEAAAPAAAEAALDKPKAKPVTPASSAAPVEAPVKAPQQNVAPPAAKTGKPQQPEAPAEKPADNVDDLLAAVEAMRAKRPGLRARKAPPTNEEMNRRRQQLRESVGRILASL